MEVIGEGREIRRDGAHGRGSRRVSAAEEEIDGLHAVKAASVETSDLNKDERQELVVLPTYTTCFLCTYWDGRAFFFLAVIGTSFALNILFHIPVWAGVLITGLSTLLLLGLQRYGVNFNPCSKPFTVSDAIGIKW
ncbi:hypothetical protein B296_00041346 [Ensete ventricosum]|uniref:Uncharacterized protein n=1 Tax=Ensete ventricosum TaxID=4639 RepID=A0A426ZM41_ENSVE|nr:hypothetical protein B296_00041346 [Ensete ventricosum]